MEVAAVVCLGWIFAVCFHEFGHAIVAYWGGDTSVKEKGYLTFNIFKYTDPGMTLFFPILFLVMGGIALPGAAVYIDHRKLRGRLWQSAVAAAGPVATLLCAAVLALPFLLDTFPPFVPLPVWVGLSYLLLLLCFSFVLNSLPLPPFDGYGVIEPWLPPAIQDRMLKFGQFSIWIIFLVLWTVPAANRVLWTVSYDLAQLFSVPPELINTGASLFQKNSGWLVVALIAMLFLMRKRTQKVSPTELYQQAQKSMADNEPLEALAALNQALNANSHFAEAWHLRGLALGIMNRNEDALESFAVALKVKPDYADCWYNKACCNALLGKHSEALADLQHAINLNPQGLREHARQDIGFRSLWDDAGFRRLVEQTPADPVV